MGATRFGSSFLVITGLHGLHVPAGVIYLTVVALRVWNGFYDRKGTYETVEITALYWHFSRPGLPALDAHHHFHVPEAGFIVAIFMHMAWERLALKLAIPVPPLCLLVLIGLMAAEGDYTLLTRGISFLK